jgi:peptidoglycan/xylan/chitin deacetylase (PgdA/CDA1 family)
VTSQVSGRQRGGADVARPERGAGGRAPVRSASAVPILLYHEIGVARTPPGPTAISVERFREQMDFLAVRGYTTLSIDQLLGFLDGKAVPERSVVLTFDDGWKSVEAAVPLLEKHGFKAAFFIITGAADGRFGPDYLSWPQVESLARNPLFAIGSHSVTHPWDPANSFLTWCEGKPAGKSIEDVRSELLRSRESLEAHLHKRIDSWAWPCGWTNAQLTAEARKAGYRVQLTTFEKPNVPGVSPSEIRRYFVDGTWDINTFARFLSDAARAPEKLPR